MHDHAGVHSHVPRRAVLAAAGITLVAGTVEILGAWRGRSMFLVADALHLIAHLGIFGVLLIPPGPSHERGEDMTTLSVLSIVLAIAIVISLSSIRELLSAHGEPPQPVFMLLAIVGLLANLAAAVLLRRPAEKRWSFRAALAHELSDGALTLVGLAGALVLKLLGWTWIDPGLSLLIGGWLVFWSLRLLLRRLRAGPGLWTDEPKENPDEPHVH